MANILIAGADSLAGQILREKSFSILDEVWFLESSELKQMNATAILKWIQEREIDTLIVTGGQALEEAVVGYLAKVAAQEDCLLVYLSTAEVFEGIPGKRYIEKDLPCPLTERGKKSRREEQVIEASHCLSIIIRTGIIYALQKENQAKEILQKVRSQDRIELETDQQCCLTEVNELAQLLQKVMENDERTEYLGTYHFCDCGVCGWREWTEELVRLEERDCTVTVKEQASTVYPELDSSKTEKIWGITPKTWQAALKDALFL